MSENGMIRVFETDYDSEIDLSSVRTVRCGPFRVRVATRADGGFIATVIEHKRGAIARALGGVVGDRSEWGATDGAPTVAAEREYIAVGAAVENYYDPFEEDADDA